MSSQSNTCMNLNNQKISAVVITKNEENTISACLDSIRWCNEILIIDDNSIDNTVHIAKRYGAKIVNHSLNNDFASQRNFALLQVKNDWVLFVDADEEVPNALVFEIQNILNQPFNAYNGFNIKRRDHLWGRRLTYGEVGNTKLLRLGKKDKGRWIGNVHEKWEIKGRVGELQNSIIHYPHKTVFEFLKEIDLYTTIRARELFKKGNKVSFIGIILYPVVKFLQGYIVRRGFMDGIPGFIIAGMMSFHSFLVRAKLFLLVKNSK